MALYSFLPNNFAKEAFDLASTEYTGNEVTPLLEEVFGKDICHKYLPAQDFFYMPGVVSSPVSAIINPDYAVGDKPRFATVGTIYKLG